MVLGKAGAAVVIEQKDVTSEKIISEIESLYKSPDRVEVMSQSAADLHLTDTNERILAVVDKLIARGKKK